jgi:mono/diheme cytochrome c family protein
MFKPETLARTGFLLFLMILFAACSGQAAPTPTLEPTEAPAEVEEEHVDDEHMDEGEHSHDSSDHMASAHGVPEEAAAVPNPISDTEDSVTAGGEIFTTNCTECHGAEGRGDGSSAASLETKPADLTADHVQELSDGALFYIISHGKPETPMPAWEGVLEEGDRWNVVNFLRTLVDEQAEEEHMKDEHMEGDEHMEDEHSE